MKSTAISDRAAMTSGVMCAQAARAQLDVGRAAYHLLRPRGPASPALFAAYTAWRDGWGTTFHELGDTRRLPSDDFTRLDQVCALLADGRCIAVTGLRWLDLALPSSLDDSYFEHWPRHVLESLGGGVIGVGCNTLIVPEWRGALVHPATEGDPLPLKDVMFRMALRSFLDSPARVFVGITRNDRNMHRVASGLGSRRMARIELHGIESDICGWTRSDVVTLGPIVDELWARRSES